MTTQYDVKSAHVEATGDVTTFRARLKGYQCLSGGTAGSVIFTDGSADGTELLRFSIPNNTNNPFFGLVPGEGILFGTSIYVTIPTGAKVTVFYG
jgi:hypothetical protein